MTSTITVEAHGEDLCVEWTDYSNDKQILDDGTVIRTTKYTEKKHIVRDGTRTEFHLWDPRQSLDISVVEKNGDDR